MTTTKHTHHAEIQRPDPAHEIERVMRWLDAYRAERWAGLDSRMDYAAIAARQELSRAKSDAEAGLLNLAAKEVSDAAGMYMDDEYCYQRGKAEYDMLYTLMCLVAGYPQECECVTPAQSCPACRSAGMLERWERAHGYPVATVELPVDSVEF